jgi:hypothetical protein
MQKEHPVPASYKSLHPEGHADQAQYEADPLLDNNNHLGLSAFLFASSLLPHTLSDTQSALATEVSDIFMKTAGAAIVALNRGYDFGRQYSACACVSHQVPLHKPLLYMQYDFRYSMYTKSSMLSFAERALSGGGSQYLMWPRLVGLTLLNLTTLNPPERKADVRWSREQRAMEA